MLISKNKKMIAKSIALMLAFVLTFSFVLTACKDKDARADVTNLETNLGTIGDKVTALEEANKSNVTTTALAETLAKYLQTAKFDENIAAILAEYEKTADAHKFVTDLLEGYVTTEALNNVLSGYYTKEEIDAVKTGIETAMTEALKGYYTKAEVDAIKAELSGALTEALKGYYTKAEVEAIKDAIVATFANYYDKAAVDAVKAELNGLIADRYTKAEVEGIKNTIVAKFDAYYTTEQVDAIKTELANAIKTINDNLPSYCTDAEAEAIKTALETQIAAVDTAVKAIDVDGAIATAVAGINTTLEGYLTTEDAGALKTELEGKIDALEAKLVNYYTKEEANKAIDDAIALALANYYTKEAADAAIKAAIAAALAEQGITGEVTLDDLLKAALENYWTAEEIKAELAKYALMSEVTALIEGVKAETAELLAGYLETEAGMKQVLDLVEAYVDEFYAGKVDDWNEATQSVIETLGSLADVLDAVDGSIYTVEDWKKYTDELERVFGVEYADFTSAATAPNGQLWIEVMRSLSVEDFAKIDTFVTFAEGLDTAEKAIAAINKLIADLQTATAADGIDTDDKAALETIKKAIADFDAKYGFNATSITVELDTTAFATGFAGIALDAAGIAAKLQVNNGYNENNDYLYVALTNENGLKLTDYVNMQNAYDYLVEFYTLINNKIDALETKVGGIGAETLDDADRAEILLLVKLVEDGNADVDGDAVVDYIDSFKTANNEKLDPIAKYELYRYYKWLEYKYRFIEECAVAKAGLDAYATEVAERFFNVDMNVANTEVVVGAKEAIDAIVYPDFNSEVDPTATARGELDAIVDAAEAAMEDNYAKAVFAQEQAAAVAKVDEYKTNNLTDAKYADIAKAADDYKVAIAKIAPKVDPETGDVVAGGYKAALDEVEDAKKGALDALELMKTKYDRKVDITNQASTLYTSNFTGSESNAAEILTAVMTAANNTFASIDAATTVAEANAAYDAAVKAVSKVVYTNKLNNLISDTQTYVFTRIKANTAVADYGYATIFALRTVGTDFAALDSADWADDYTKAAAKVALVKAQFDNKEDLLKDADVLYADSKYDVYADEIAAIVEAGLADIDAATDVAGAAAAKDAAIAAATKLYFTDALAAYAATAKTTIGAIADKLADANVALGLVDTAVAAFADDTTDYAGALAAIDLAVADAQTEAINAIANAAKDSIETNIRPIDGTIADAAIADVEAAVTDFVNGTITYDAAVAAIEAATVVPM